ncbi:hypothetical protein DV740_06520 [Roseburia sp. AF02-12]|uniref:T7SS effector LXG polymorphic toxin n=1 Tax=unclassified Roseburia TaxID=2637578 RepID=UPI000E54CC79|nr:MULTISPECIES: T7SS effector LXG polymorphic toxin [unclassified Roseburia]RGF58893.1 hypothetical protein DWZ65_06765 [Roseburia sp. AF34-16]RGH31044.1 hypothetical protein DV740_06520 [Roseburia sp. AF02-12]
MEGFVIKYTDINNLLWEYKSKLEGLISKLETCERSINQFIQSDQFIGETATAAKNYLYDVHITMISCLKVATQNMLDDIAYHKACYNEIDGSTNFRLDEEAIREFRTKLAANSADTESYAQSVQQAVSNISDISDVNTPGTNGIIELHEQLDQELLNFIETIQTQESTTVTIIENTVDLMVDSIKNCLGKIGTSKTAITTYTSNSFYTDIDVYTLAYLSEYFYQQHTVNQETYDAIWDVEQQLKDAAEEREVQGVIKAIGGIVLVVVGVACIAASLGAATPAVVAAGTMIGSGTTVFGITDTAEGAQDVYYGSISDLDSTAVNRLKEVVFQGNEETYYFTEGVFSFAASAFIPIGKASTVGKLTFRSGSTIIAKEGLSTLAGEGVSKLTTDLSGNQTVGMMAGMLASGLTSHGLDKLDVKFKQKSFTDLMKQGMVVSSNFSVDDIIKGVENGEIPLSNNIQKGNYGEMKMDAYFESQGYERISLDRVTDLNAPNHQGIDGVYYNPDGHPPYVIGEAKYGNSRLGNTLDGPQMSDDWIYGSNRLLKAVGKEMYDDILVEGYGKQLIHIDKNGVLDVTAID